MRKLLVLAILALPVLLVITLPARVAVRVLDSETLPLERIGGTVWRGQAVWSTPGYAPLDLDWQWRAPWQWTWRLTGPGTELDGVLNPARGRLHLSDIAGALPVDRLDLAEWLPFTRPGGRLNLEFPLLVLSGREIVEAGGRVVWEDARLSGAVDEDLGRIELAFSDHNGVRARIRSLDPVDVIVRGTLDIEGTAFDLDIWLQTRRPDVQRSLARMGEVQPDGQVRMQHQGWLF